MVPPDAWKLCQQSVPDCLAIADKPLYEWSTRQSFDSAAPCEEIRSKITKQGTVNFNDGNFGKDGEQMTWARTDTLMHSIQNFSARCVATDDPRLKEK
jgi:hypothetical protein